MPDARTEIGHATLISPDSPDKSTWFHLKWDQTISQFHTFFAGQETVETLL